MLKKRGMPERVSNICIDWQSTAPFLAEFLLRFKYKEKPDIGTMGVLVKDNRVELAYSPDFIESLPRLELEGVLFHEILHILNKFHDRIGNRVHDIFNIAQDACINETVVQTSINGSLLEIPEYGVRMQKIRNEGYDGEEISEAVYDFLYEKADKFYFVQPSGGSSESSPGGTSDPSEEEGDKKTFSTTDNHEGHRTLDEVEKAALEELVSNARSRSFGSMSGNAVSTIKQLISAKKIPWRKKLAMLLSRYVNEPGNIYENTWSKRNRRNLPLPGIRKQSKKLVISVDTSGSVSDRDLSMFFDQIEKLVKDYAMLTIVEWDTQVHRAYQYKKGDWKKIKVHGRGGTDIQDLYDYVNTHLKKTSLLINFTDGYFSWSFNNYDIPTVWALVNNDMKPTFGKTVYVVDEKSK